MMPEKAKIETPAPTMADIIRNRAYQLWGVQPAAPEGGARKTSRTAKKAAATPTKATKPAKSTKPSKASSAAKATKSAKPTKPAASPKAKARAAKSR
jgi:hypothetical protein